MKRLQPVIQTALVALLAALAFVSVMPHGGFVFDDHVLIERNQDIGRSDIWWKAFDRDYYETSVLVGKSGYYRPVAVLANATDLRLWRLKRDGYHLTNLVMHAVASAALMGALRALGAPGAVAWMVALLFAMHPVHAESVAFVSGRVDVLATIGAFLAMAAAASRWRFAWLGLGVATLFALLSKESAVVLPFLLLLVWIARVLSNREPAPAAGAAKNFRASAASDRWLTKQAAAVAVACVVALVLRHTALHAWLPATAQGAPLAPSPLLFLKSVLFALASVYAPARALSLEPSPAHLSALRLGLGALVAVALWLAAWRWDAASRPLLRRSSWAAFLALLPVLNLLPQETLLSERFLYLASGFLLVPAGVLVVAGWQRGGALRPVAVGACATAMLIMLGISEWRGISWRNDLRLWRQAVREEPDRAAFWDRLGLAYSDRFRFEEAEPALRKAVELDPSYFNSYFNLGTLLTTTKRQDEAVGIYRKAIALQPRHVEAHVNLGLALMGLGDVQNAYTEFQSAARLNPDHFQAVRLAGAAAQQLGRPQDARVYLERALQLKPEDESIIRILDHLRNASTSAPQIQSR